MIKISCIISDINYASIVELAMPYIDQWVAEKGNAVYGLLSKVISKEGKPTGFSKFVISVLPNKNKMMASILPHFDEVLLQYLNDLIRKQNVLANISLLKFETVEGEGKDMLKIEITVDTINYEQSVANLAPILLQNLAGMEGKAGKIGQLLLATKELPGNMLVAAIGAVPLEQRDELLAAILSEFNVEITDAVNNAIQKNNLSAQVSDISIQS